MPLAKKRKVPIQEEDEDDDIYGTGAPREPDTAAADAEPECPPGFIKLKPVDFQTDNNIWCLLYRESGSLEFYSMTGFQLMYHIH
jgi:hypothetical protein